MAQFWSIQSTDEFLIAKTDEDGDVVIKRRNLFNEIETIYFTKDQFEEMIAAYLASQSKKS